MNLILFVQILFYFIFNISNNQIIIWSTTIVSDITPGDKIGWYDVDKKLEFHYKKKCKKKCIEKNFKTIIL